MDISKVTSIETAIDFFNEEIAIENAPIADGRTMTINPIK